MKIVENPQTTFFELDTHAMHLCGKPSIWHTVHVPSTNVGENDTPSAYAQKNHHDCSSLVLYFVEEKGSFQITL